MKRLAQLLWTAFYIVGALCCTLVVVGWCVGMSRAGW